MGKSLYCGFKGTSGQGSVRRLSNGSSEKRQLLSGIGAAPSCLALALG